MLRNYLTITFRELVRNKVFSSINILGLGIGIGISILILKFVSFEFSYDNFYEDQRQIYRIPLKRNTPDGIKIKAGNVPALAPTLRQEIPEVIYAARLFRQDITEPYCIASYKNTVDDLTSFDLENVYYTDPSIIQIFSIEMLEGNKNSALNNPNTIVLSESLAQKFFGSDRALGKTIRIRTGGMEHHRTELSLQVSGVVEDPRPNSHLQYEAMISYATFRENFMTTVENHWGWTQFYTYVKLKENADPKAFKNKLNSLTPSEWKEAWEDLGYKHESLLQPVNKIHVNSGYLEEPTHTISRSQVMIFVIMAIFVLLVAWINYINLTTARSLKRSREVVIRKIIGAQRSHLVNQFFVEALIFNIIGLFVGLGMVEITQPYLENIIGRPLEWPPGFNPFLIAGILSFMVSLGTIVSGLYPAFIISSFQPLNILKGKLLHSRQGITVRRGLVVFQFIISITLITSTLFIYRQLNHMKNQELGFNMEQTLVLKANIDPGPDYHNFKLFKQSLESYPFIKSISASSTIPSEQLDAQVFAPSDQRKEEFIAGIQAVDHDFVQTLGLNLIAGRSFEKEFGSDTTSVVINESAASQLGYSVPEEAVNNFIFYPRFNKRLKIVGVISDYYHSSVKEDKPSIILQFRHHINPYAPYDYFLTRLNTNNLQESIRKIQDEWNELFPGFPYHAFFLDTHFNQQYEEEARFSKLTGLFSIFAIFIGLIGLFGLVSFTFSLKIKEIGIRKVLGASLKDLLILFWKDYMKLITLSGVIAVPLCYFGVSGWLESYPVRIQLEWWFFAIPVLLISLLAFLIVGKEILKVALINPSESLKEE